MTRETGDKGTRGDKGVKRDKGDRERQVRQRKYVHCTCKESRGDKRVKGDRETRESRRTVVYTYTCMYIRMYSIYIHVHTCTVQIRCKV